MKPELLALLDEKEKERYERIERHRIIIQHDITRSETPYAGMGDALEEVKAECALYHKLAEARKVIERLKSWAVGGQKWRRKCIAVEAERDEAMSKLQTLANTMCGLDESDPHDITDWEDTLHMAKEASMGYDFLVLLGEEKHGTIWHHCAGTGRVRTYPRIMCSLCKPEEESKDFDAYAAVADCDELRVEIAAVYLQNRRRNLEEGR